MVCLTQNDCCPLFSVGAISLEQMLKVNNCDLNNIYTLLEFYSVKYGHIPGSQCFLGCKIYCSLGLAFALTSLR